MSTTKIEVVIDNTNHEHILAAMRFMSIVGGDPINFGEMETEEEKPEPKKKAPAKKTTTRKKTTTKKTPPKEETEEEEPQGDEDDDGLTRDEVRLLLKEVMTPAKKTKIRNKLKSYGGATSVTNLGTKYFGEFCDYLESIR